MHINIKRARKRNGLKGGVHMAKAIFTNIANAKDIFSREERDCAIASLVIIAELLGKEPKNYIVNRYGKAAKR